METAWFEHLGGMVCLAMPRASQGKGGQSRLQKAPLSPTWSQRRSQVTHDLPKATQGARPDLSPGLWAADRLLSPGLENPQESIHSISSSFSQRKGNPKSSYPLGFRLASPPGVLTVPLILCSLGLSHCSLLTHREAL